MARRWKKCQTMNLLEQFISTWSKRMFAATRRGTAKAGGFREANALQGRVTGSSCQHLNTTELLIRGLQR